MPFTVDLSECSFDDFVDFFFDREVEPPRPETLDTYTPWHHDANIDCEFDNEVHARHFARLFRDPAFLLERFSSTQLEAGFWAMFGEPPYGGIDDVLWYDSLDWSVREAFARSMGDLYAKLFAIDPLDTSSHMWWDAITYDFQDKKVEFADLYPDAERMEPVLLETLTAILAIDSLSCQVAALHGLGHLQHPKTAEVIEAYLAAHPDLAEENVAYARACIAGEML